MLKKYAGRGRPKGTGIDDSDRIAGLLELLRNNPELKPTTAIRAMGVSDPSAIRRIRDKFHQALLSGLVKGAGQTAPGAHLAVGPLVETCKTPPAPAQA
jgi:hypothetical protein